MRSLKRGLVSLALISGLFSVPAMALTRVVDASGNLTGARNVDVGGTLFDVDLFTAASCSAELGLCNTLTTFTFSTLAAANLASQALLDQVFVGTYDNVAMNIQTPWRVYLAYTRADGSEVWGTSYSRAVNVGLASTDSYCASNPKDSFCTDRVESSQWISGYTTEWAGWRTASVAPSVVPLPASGLMLLTVFGGIAALRRRKQRAA